MQSVELLAHLDQGHSDSPGELYGVFPSIDYFGELALQVVLGGEVLEVHLGEDGGGGGEVALGEVRVPVHAQLQDLVRGAEVDIPSHAPVSPPRSLSLGVQVHLHVPGGAQVPVRLHRLPAEVDVEVPLGAGGADLEVVLEEELLGLGPALGESSLPGHLGLQPVSIGKGDLGLELIVGEGVVSIGQLTPVDLDLPLVVVASSGNNKGLEKPLVSSNLLTAACLIIFDWFLRNLRQP